MRHCQPDLEYGLTFPAPLIMPTLAGTLTSCVLCSRRPVLGRLQPESLRVLITAHRRSASSLPHVGQASFWKSLIPKPLRPGHAPAADKPRSREWNPATFFLLIFLVIGSNAIQTISLKRDFSTFMRQSDVRIGLLREVVEKLQKGEQVDVEKLLGTGDAQKEQEWEDGTS
jgi:hypothetical protein